MTAARLPKPGESGVLYLVDLSGYVFRAYHAIAPLSSSKGEPTHAVMGTVNMLQKIVNGRKPDMFAVAMDSRVPNFRKAIDDRYKANRPPPPPDLKQQMGRCEEIVRAYNVPVYQEDGVEADDVIASVVARAVQDPGVRVVIVSADKDLMQLVRDGDDRVVLWDSMRDRVYGPDEVKEKFGVVPSRLRDFLALTGDTSDNVPGVPSVGPKTASDLLNQYETLEGLYAHLDDIKRAKLRDALRDNEADARISQRLVTLKSDCDIAWDREHLKYGGANVDELRRLFAELEFTRLLDSLGGAAGGGGSGGGGRASEAPKPTRTFTVTPATLLATKDDVTALVAQAQRDKKLAIHVFGTDPSAIRAEVVGVALATSEAAASYLPVSHRYLGAPPQIAWEEAVSLLRPALEDATVMKVGHDLKFAEVLFARAGVRFEGPRFDALLATYLLDPEAPHDLRSLAEREFGAALPLTPHETPARTGKGTGKGKGAVDPFEMMETERAKDVAGPRAALGVALATALVPRLETEGLAKLADEVEFPLERVLADMETRGVLVDTDKLVRASTRLEAELLELEGNAKRVVGHEFSIRSRDQLETILFDDLKLPVLKRTPKGGRSTDAEVLEELATLHELPQIICDFRELDKLKGTYLDALPRSRNARTGRIHTRFEQAVAATGRLSSTDPNLQNIPIRTEVGKEIRAAFVAPPGMRIVSADYSQIELRVLAHLSQDPELCAAFSRSEDVHTHTASLIFEVPKAEVTGEMRRRAKTINFGVIYGMGDSALGKQLRIPRAEAARFIAAYFERYEGVRKFMERTVDGARRGEAVRTMLGRRRFLPNLHSANRGLRFEAERIAKNTPIQGTAADILKVAMVRLGDAPPTPSARMVLTVHDELVFEVAQAEVAEARERIRAAMMGAATLSVPLVVDVGDGLSWAEAH